MKKIITINKTPKPSSNPKTGSFNGSSKEVASQKTMTTEHYAARIAGKPAKPTDNGGKT